MKEQKHDSVTDQGWAAMQQLLDLRMPRRRRRVGGWWWLTGLLLLPIVGVTAWHWYQPSKALSAPSGGASRPNAPLALQERSLTAGRPHESNSVMDQNQLPDWATFKKIFPVQSNQPAMEQPTVGREAIRNTTARTVSDGNARESLENSGIQSIVATPELPPAQSSSTETAENSAGQSQENSAISALATLPTPFQALDQELVAPNLPDYPAYSSPEIIKAPRPAVWAFGLAFGANSERLPRVNGGLIGLTVDWQPLRHWGLRSGVQYAMQRLASDESLVTTIAEDAYERSSKNLSVFDQDGNYGPIDAFSSINTNILASVRRIHRIEAPLMVYWQPVHPFRVYAGAILNYTFLAQTSNRIFSDNQVFKVVSGRDEINRLATERIQRWQVKWQAGLGYRLGRVEINASIQTTFPKISFKRSAGIERELDAATQTTSNSFMQVRQLGVTLGGVLYF